MNRGGASGLIWDALGANDARRRRVKCAYYIHTPDRRRIDAPCPKAIGCGSWFDEAADAHSPCTATHWAALPACSRSSSALFHRRPAFILHCGLAGDPGRLQDLVGRHGGLTVRAPRGSPEPRRPPTGERKTNRDPAWSTGNSRTCRRARSAPRCARRAGWPRVGAASNKINHEPCAIILSTARLRSSDRLGAQRTMSATRKFAPTILNTPSTAPRGLASDAHPVCFAIGRPPRPRRVRPFPTWVDGGLVSRCRSRARTAIPTSCAIWVNCAGWRAP